MWYVYGGLISDETVEFILKLVQIMQLHVKLFFQTPVGNIVAESRMPVSFMNVSPYLMFQVMHIDELNMKYIVKVLYTLSHINIHLSRCEIVQFIFKIIDLLTVAR